MTTTGIDPAIRDQVLALARNGAGLRQIGNETGLMDKEIRLIIDAEKRRLAENPNTAPAIRQLPPTRAPAARTPAPTPPPVAGRAPSRLPPPPADSIAALIDQAEASDMAKVRSAARRTVLAIDNLRMVMDATETERREKAAAKAKAAKEKAEAAERERVARATVEALARQLKEAKANLAAVAPTKSRPGARGPRNISPETREKFRQNALRTQAKRRARREAEAAT